MLRSKKITLHLTLITGLAAFLLAGCGLDQTEQPQSANAVLAFQLIDEESEDPIPDTNVAIGAIFEGEEQTRNMGTVVTDESGAFEGIISGADELTIITVVFGILVNGSEQIIEESVNLELRFQEPLDRVELTVVVQNSD